MHVAESLDVYQQRAEGVMNGGGLLASPPLTNTPEDYLLLYKVLRLYLDIFVGDGGMVYCFVGAINYFEGITNEADVIWKQIYEIIYNSENQQHLEGQMRGLETPPYFNIYEDNNDTVIEADIWRYFKENSGFKELFNNMDANWPRAEMELEERLKDETTQDLYDSIKKTRMNQVKIDNEKIILEILRRERQNEINGEKAQKLRDGIQSRTYNKVIKFFSYFKKLEDVYRDNPLRGTSHEIYTRVAEFAPNNMMRAISANVKRLTETRLYRNRVIFIGHFIMS